MKLIIDISEEDYRECKFRKDLLSLGEEPTDLTFNMRMETLIANGTPLPKNHGRLIDEDEIVKTIEDRVEFLRKNDAVFLRLHKDIDILGCIPKIRCEVPTIIEADKEYKE